VWQFKRLRFLDVYHLLNSESCVSAGGSGTHLPRCSHRVWCSLRRVWNHTLPASLETPEAVEAGKWIQQKNIRRSNVLACYHAGCQTVVMSRAVMSGLVGKARVTQMSRWVRLSSFERSGRESKKSEKLACSERLKSGVGSTKIYS
jgi:hypothetical protein